MFRTRIKALIRRRTSGPLLERELDDEVRSYINAAIHEKIAQGFRPEEARRAALIEFGGAEQVKELVRSNRTGASLESFGRDVKRAIRLLLRNRAFAALAILTIAIGIGASTATFSVVDTVVLRPLPYPNADRLALVWAAIPAWQNDPAASLWWNQFMMFYPQYDEWRKRQTAFEDTSVFRNRLQSFVIKDEMRQVGVGMAPSSLFALLGLRPALGRLFLEEDERADGAPVTLLSYSVWQHEFGGDPSVLGTGLRQSDSRSVYTVVGVLPADFEMPGHGSDYASVPEIWLPLTDRERNGGEDFEVLGRLKRGLSLADAEREADAIILQLDHPQFPADLKVGAHITRLQEQETRRLRTSLYIVLAASGMLLLIACANVANLLLGHAVQREHEIAVRAALGASRGQIVRQLLIESLVLSLAGAVIGGFGGSWIVRALIRMAPAELLRATQVTLDLRLLLFIASLATISAILFGLAPALTLARMDVETVLKQTARTRSPQRARLQRMLIVGEISISFVLLIGAGLLAKTMWRLTQVSSGLDSAGLITSQLRLPDSRYPNAGQIATFYDSLFSRLRSLPGVENVSAISTAPFSGRHMAARVQPEAVVVRPGQERPHIEWRGILTNYFVVAGIPMIEGMPFNESADPAARSDRIIINRAFARQFWPGESAVNKRVRIESRQAWSTVIGVVEDAKEFAMWEDPTPVFYMPYRQLPGSVTLVVRAINAAQLTNAVQREIRAADPELQIGLTQTMDSAISASLAPIRYEAIIIVFFAVVAASLALIGLYGAVSRFVAYHARELGIRIAIGATPRSVVWSILRQSLWLGTVGIGFGAVAALTATQALSALMFGIKTLDPATYVIVGLGFLMVTLLAGYLPARRASSLDPAACLRAE